MIKPKFTLGPWCAYPDDQGGVGQDSYVLVDDGASPVARVMCYTPRDFNRKPYEANAHLIAAAPDMYEALERLNKMTIHATAADWDAAWDAARAATAKARGEK